MRKTTPEALKIISFSTEIFTFSSGSYIKLSQIRPCSNQQKICFKIFIPPETHPSFELRIRLFAKITILCRLVFSYWFQILNYYKLIIFFQDSEPRTTPPPPYNHQNCQEIEAIPNSNLFETTKSKNDVALVQNIMSLSSISGNLDNIGSSVNCKRTSSRITNDSFYSIKSSVVRYNRRNNPELERRRTHHCDFLGMNSLELF